MIDVLSSLTAEIRVCCTGAILPKLLQEIFVLNTAKSEPSETEAHC